MLFRSGRRENRLREVAAECPGVHFKVCDIGIDTDRHSLLAYVQKNFPDLNVLINNGAVQNDYDLAAGLNALDYAPDEININLTAPIMLNGMFIPFLIDKADPVIINVTSILGFTPLTRIPIYCAAKAGFHVYTLELRKHLENTPITVFEVPPPRVETELNPEGRKRARPGTESDGLQPDEYAEFVVQELKKNNLDIFYGSDGDIKRRPRFETELSRLE